MPDELTTRTFIAGTYASPRLTGDFPAFAPPTPERPLTVLAGNALALHVPAPSGGGTLSLEVYVRGDQDRTNLVQSEAPLTLSGNGAPNVGDDVAWTLGGEFTAALPADTYPYAFVQSTGSGINTVHTVVGRGSFDVLSVGF